MKPSPTRVSAASSSSAGSGSSVLSSPITSSFTQSVPSASRASRAVVTASRAVKQPAVFGSTSQPADSSVSRIDPGAEGSTRRIATVASSAPDALAASAIAPRLRKPPVPSTRRERSSRPAIWNALPSPPCTAWSTSSSCPSRSGVLVPPAARHHLAVHGHRHAAAAGLHAGLAHRLRHGGARRAAGAARR